MSDTDHIVRKIYTLVQERIEPEIERDLTIPLIEPPMPFKGYLTEEQVSDFKDSPGVVPMLVGLSKVEQGQDFVIQHLLNLNRYVRMIQAEQFRLRQRISKETEDRQAASRIDLWDIIKRVVVWVLISGAAGAVGYTLKK